jgi:hypothetical protein
MVPRAGGQCDHEKRADRKPDNEERAYDSSHYF